MLICLKVVLYVEFRQSLFYVYIFHQIERNKKIVSLAADYIHIRPRISALPGFSYAGACGVWSFENQVYLLAD